MPLATRRPTSAKETAGVEGRVEGIQVVAVRAQLCNILEINPESNQRSQEGRQCRPHCESISEIKHICSFELIVFFVLFFTHICWVAKEQDSAELPKFLQAMHILIEQQGQGCLFIASERTKWSRELKTDEKYFVLCKHSLSYLVINRTSAVFIGGSTSLKLLPHYGQIIRSAGKLTPAPAKLFFFQY